MKAKQRSATDQKPNAWIVNPKDKGRKSIKTGNKIYLSPDQNFEIELFNPLTEAVLSEIKVNGKSVSSTGLVIRPGERCYLDCFVDDKKKFVFKTYSVEDTEESKNAISKNGVVEIFFYKEETLKLNNWREILPIIERRYYPVYPYWWNWPYYPYHYTYPYYTTNNTMGSGCYGTTNNLNINSTTTSFNLSNADFVGNCSTQALYSSNINKQTFETGRIEKGELSSQTFEDIDMQFEKYHISNVIYQLLPESQRPIETKELKKFCEECGKNLKGTEKFCSECGNKLI